jgi:phage anti-repressor protein
MKKIKIYLMKKGEGKFFIKTVYLILVIVSINLFIFQYISLNKRQNEIVNKIDIKIAAENILNQIVSSDECLAYKENIEVQGNQVNQVTHKTLDLKKILEFETKFSDFEPNCTKNYGYGYYVIIEKYNFTRQDKEREDMPPFNGKDVVLVLDATKSMEEGNKFNAQKEAAKNFIDCASEENRLGIVVIKSCNDIEVFEDKGKNLVKISGNKDKLKYYIDMSSTSGWTDIKNSLKKAFEILQKSDKPERYKMILLLTDGCESCGDCSNLGGFVGSKCPYYSNYCLSCPKGKNICDEIPNDDKIHVFTVGLFTTGCKREEIYGGEQLKCVSEKTKGKYYLATSTGRLASIFCQLGHGATEAKDKTEIWSIGPKEHSLDESLKSTFSFSLPVSIRYNETYTQSGKITIYIFDGELERLATIINQACNLESLEDEISLSYKAYLKEENELKKICMQIKDKEICKALTCSKKIDLKDLNPGTYKLKTISSEGYLKVIV